MKILLSLFLLFVIVSCTEETPKETDIYKDLISIDITNKDSISVIEESNKIRFFAQGTMKDATTKVLDVEKLKWHSSDTSIAYISDDGLFTAIRQGVTIITASYGDIESNEVNMRVVSENGLQGLTINIAGASNKFFVGDRYQVKALGRYGTGETQDLTESVIWYSSDESIAKISNSFGSHGRMSIEASGSVEIYAKVNGLESNHIPILTEAVSVVSVSLSVDKSDAYIDERISLSAVAKLSNGDEKSVIEDIEWKYETTLLPTKTDNNQIYCEEAGTYRFYVIYDNIKSETVELNISERQGVLQTVELILTPNQDIYQNETRISIKILAHYNDHTEDVTYSSYLVVSPNSVPAPYFIENSDIVFTEAGDFSLRAEFEASTDNWMLSEDVNIHVNEPETGVVPDVDELVINEMLIAPPYEDGNPLIGDANNDGIRDSTDDEFIEIVNVTNKILDLSNIYLSDLNDNVIASFPDGTLLRPHQVIVIFGGGTPTGDFGGATVFTLNQGSLSLNNNGDLIFINISDDDSDISNDTTIFSALYGEWNKDFGSAVLSPELEKEGTDWEYKHHYEESGNSSYFSPGTKMDGSLFFN